MGAGVGSIVQTSGSGSSVETGSAGVAGAVTVDARVDSVAHVATVGTIVGGFVGIVGVASCKGCL